MTKYLLVSFLVESEMVYLDCNKSLVIETYTQTYTYTC